MKTRIVPLVLALAIGTGLVVGALAPRPEDAGATGSTSYWYGIPVQADNVNAQLTCGWHTDACSVGANGVALDWDRYSNWGYDNTNVYLRGEGYSPGVPYPTHYSHAIPREAAGFGSSCDWNIVLDVYRWGYFDDGHWLTTTYYVHGLNPGGDIAMYYQDNGWATRGT